MRRDYVPVIALEGGEHVRLTGPAWRATSRGEPTWGDVVKVEWVETLDSGDRVAAFQHHNPVTGETRYWTINDGVYHAAFVSAD